MEGDREIDQARTDFQKMLKEKSLPPKMEAKLRYLEAGALGQQAQPALIQQLPEFEKLSLQMMSRETKVSLFSSIMGCLVGRDLVTYFTSEPSSIKREDSSDRSTPCFLSCTSESLSVFKNKNETQPLHLFPISKLLVAKTYHREKKRFIFGIAFDSVKYRFKFEQEGPCARIHGDLLTAIRQKRALRIQSEQKEKRQKMMSEELELESQWDETGEQLILDEERQFLRVLLKKIEQSSLDSTDHFQLVRNIGSGKIMANKTRGTVKVLMFLQRCSLEGLIQSYIQFSAWNVQVETFEITKRIRHNTFLAYMKMKKKSVFSSSREGYFTISYFKHCACLKNSYTEAESEDKFQVKHYLILSNTPAEAEPREGVPMKFNQIVQFAEMQGRPGVVFINLLSSIDFNVYQYFQNSTDLNLQFVEEVGSIAVLCREREIMQSSKCQLFEFGTCVCDRKRKKEVFQSFSAMKNSVGQSRKNSILSEPDHRSLPFEEASPSKHQEPLNLDYSFSEIVSIISEHNELKTQEKIVEVISKKMFERYYLGHRFSEELREKSHIQSGYRLGERVNYLSLGSRWKFNNSEEFIFIDEEVLNLQKSVLKLIIKQITSNIMAGKSIMSMSLPVQLFDDFSVLESFARLFGYAPVFLNKAVKQTEIEEQIKYIMLAFVFLLSCDPKVSKPFNPILGETLQGSIGGIPFYMEQISHHPPITTFFMKNEYFQASGNIDLLVDMGLNSAHSKMPGPFRVKVYSNNTDYVIKFPEVELGGVMFGDRALRPSGRGYVLQKNSGVYLQYSFGKDKKKLYEYKDKIKHPDLAGGVFKITEKAMERLLAIENKKSVEGIKPGEALQHYSIISGKWYGDVCFDGKCYKSMKNGPFPIEFERSSLLLPSDCTFRLDIVYRRWRNFKKSNEEKEILENLQRRDCKLRQKYHPHHKH